MRIAFLTLILISAGAAARADDGTATAARLVLKQNCVRCHNAMRDEGGLRLDVGEQLQTGGTSGIPLVSRPGRSSELIRRLTTDDKSQRMPLGAEPLSRDEIATVSAWIDAGAEWSDASVQAGPPKSSLETVSEWLGEITKHSKWLLAGWLALAMGVLLIERRKKSNAQSSLHRIRGSHYLVVALLLTISLLWQHFRGVQAEDRETISSLNERLLHLANPEAYVGGDEFGPVPRRPLHTPRLSCEYYRGNDERNPKLFNGGFYRTATFRISIVDSSGKPLAVGSKLNDETWLSFDLERAKGTTRAHFEKRSMASIFLSRQALDTDVRDTPIALKVVKDDWLWRARYRLDVGDTTNLRGRIFVFCSATVQGDQITGSPHYGIEYNIQLNDGQIAEGSEIWMGSLFQTEKVVQTPKDRIPADSWFDFRPIPEIDGENTDDPELLGIGKPDGSH